MISSVLETICSIIRNKDGRAIIFGGYVRDNFFLNIENNDIDIEVYNMSIDLLEEILAPYGRVDIVGKSFSVLKLKTHDGDHYDFSLPRREVKNGEGHTSFLIESDSHMSIEEASSRRDFTINAIGYDPLTKEFIDPHHGIEDIKHKILRATSIRFTEDPLRVLRGVQFAARFGMRMDESTTKMCKDLIREFPTLSSERIANEFLKLFLQSKNFPYASYVLENTDWIRCFPILRQARWENPGTYYNNIYTIQNFIDASKDFSLSQEDYIVLCFTILLTRLTQDTHVLHQFGIFDKSIISKVGILLKNYHSYDLYSDEGIYNFAEKLKPCTIHQYCILEKFQHPTIRNQGYAKLHDRAEKLGVLHSSLKKIVDGKLLIELGFKPGPMFSEIIGEAYKLQMAGKINDRKSAINFLEKYKFCESKENDRI